MRSKVAGRSSTGCGSTACNKSRTWATLSGRYAWGSSVATSAGVGKGAVVVGRRSPLSLVQALLPPDQEVMGQEHERHVMVPPAPEPQLIVVHPQFALAL